MKHVLLIILWLALANTPQAAFAGIVVKPFDPAIPPQTPGAPPLPTLSFFRTFDFAGLNITPNVDAVFDFTRNGDFNNPTTTAGNGAPEEGVAIFLLDGSLARKHLVVFQPGISGTVHDTSDDPDNRQTFSVPFSQNLLNDVRDNDIVNVEVVFGASVDDVTHFVGSLTANATAIPEPSSLGLLGVAMLGIVFRHRTPDE